MPWVSPFLSWSELLTKGHINDGPVAQIWGVRGQVCGPLSRFSQGCPVPEVQVPIVPKLCSFSTLHSTKLYLFVPNKHLQIPVQQFCPENAPKHRCPLSKSWQPMYVMWFIQEPVGGQDWDKTGCRRRCFQRFLLIWGLRSLSSLAVPRFWKPVKYPLWLLGKRHRLVHCCFGTPGH